MQADNIVLGAGIVGVCVALHLQMRGQATVLVDRRGAGEETSYGNTGLIERGGLMPAAFPQSMAELFRYGLNNRTDMYYHAHTLPMIMPFLARYWWHSRANSYQKIVADRLPLMLATFDEHHRLIEQAGAGHLVLRDGTYSVYRDGKILEAAFKQADQLKRDFGIDSEKLDAAALSRAEPGLAGPFVGGLNRRGSWNVRDPGALVNSYRALFEALGGTTVKADALSVTPRASGAGWQLAVGNGVLEAENAVVALGPWSGDLTARLGYRLPLGVKRGYHMHYAQPEAQPLKHWVLDNDGGYFIAPMGGGIRLTTGAEFARRDARATPVQLRRVEPLARKLFPGLGAPIEDAPWLGSRPVTADMMPVIGAAPRHKGLWFAFGHGHHGLTLGPATGRLIAEMITGEPTFINAVPFAPQRFL